MAQRRIIVEEAMVFEGSESSDEEFINVPQSEPLEPALQESVLLDDPQLFEQEELETTTLEELDAFQQGPPLQAPEPPQQAQQAPEPQKAEEPAPKRSRGRPRKVQAVCQPPPERPQTPPPQQTKAQQDTCKQRSLDRRQQVLRILKKREITANEVQGMRSLMVEDEEDRHGCLGAWIWNDFKAENAYINEEITFTGEGGGMSEAAQRARTELDCFRLFFTTAVIDNLVKQTNLYAQQIGARESYLGWTPVGREDILAFMGVAMAMSVSHKGDVNEYWTTEEILEQPWFSSVMSGRRFKAISRCFHVSDNTKAAKTREGHLVDKLSKVRPLINSLLPSFRQHFKPNRELSIDEQMIGTKARCSFLQYMKDKPTKQGVKVWALCDSRVHYCLEFQIYTGGTGEKRGLSFRVVNDLMCHYLGKGHHVYFDNFYTSPKLLAHLISHNTLAVGTVQQNRVNMPWRLQTDLCRLETGQSLFLRSHRMTACRWKDKRDVFCLSTVHGNTMKMITRRKAGGRGEGEQVLKPLAICEYNTYMGGVDVYDQLLSYHPTARRYKRSWLKIFWQLFDMAVLNALALWKLKNENLPRAYHKNFRLNLIHQLVAPLKEMNVPVQLTRRRVATRLQHYGDPVSFGTRKCCTVCKNANRQTAFGCKHCGEGVRLHMNSGDEKVSCFIQYHTQANF